MLKINSNKIANSIIFTILTLVFYIVISWLVGHYIRFQLTSYVLSAIFTFLILSAIPVLILILTWILRLCKNKICDILLKCGLTGIFMLLSPMLFLGIMFITMLARIDTPLFQNKNLPILKIEKMSYDGGALDGNGNSATAVKVLYVTPALRIVTAVDTNRINKNDWLRVNK